MSTINDLIDLDIRVGIIEEAIPFPEARVPAYKLKINFGPSGFRQTSAQLTRRYQPEDLIGRKIVAALGLPPLRVAGFKSGAGFSFISARTLYHCFGISFSSR